MTPLVVLIAAVPLVYFIISVAMMVYARETLHGSAWWELASCFFFMPICALLIFAKIRAAKRWGRRGFVGRPWIC